MTALVPFHNEDLELVIDTTTGETFASIRAVARMTDKDEKTIRNYVNGRLKGADKMELKRAEIQTAGGLQGAYLLNEPQILEVLAKYNPKLLMDYAQLGLRVYLHTIVGYEHNPTPVDITQVLLNEVYGTTTIKGNTDADEDVIIRESVVCLNALNIKNKATAQIALIAANARLECEPDHSMQQNKCINTINKQLRHTRINLEGANGVPRHLLPKSERDDPENAPILNPSSKAHLLPDVAKIKSESHLPFSPIDVSKLLIPTRNGYKKQFIPALPEGFIIDIPLDNIH